MISWDVSEEDIAKLRAELRRKLENPQPPAFLRMRYDADGNLTRIKRLRPGVLPLPRRTRLRLFIARIRDRAAIWLVSRGCYDAALWVWRERR